MAEVKIFVVEDERLTGSELQARVVGLGYEIAGVAVSGEEALLKIEESKPDLVLVELQLPGETDGIAAAELIRARFALPMVLVLPQVDDALLERAKLARPFGYVLRPVTERDLHSNLEMALYRHKMEGLLQRTVDGSIRIMSEILSMVEPRAFAHGQKLKGYVTSLAQALKLERVWELEVGALLCRIGYVTIPATVIQKIHTGVPLHKMEVDMVNRVPEFGREMLARIPGLENVARIIQYHNKDFDGGGFPVDAVAGTHLPEGARMIRILSDMARYQTENMPKEAIVELMTQAKGKYDPKLLKDSIVTILLAPPRDATALSLGELRVGHVLKEAIQTNDGTTLVTAGNTISAFLLNRLTNYTELSGIKEPIYVAR